VSHSQTLAKILIVDDHPLVREGMAMRISAEHDLVVCGEAATEDAALALVGETSPDLIIVDISLKSGHGIELIKHVRSRHPTIRMLVVSGFQESLYAERALRAGAMGYLNKQESNEKMIEAIRAGLDGKRYIGPEITRRLTAQALDGRVANEDVVDQLTDRELEIFRMIGKGLTSGGIASELHLSSHTIDTHRENIKRKLGAKTAAELNRHAVQWMIENG
jgi:DNA-binding NarL/FixJ family response regulator